MAKTKTLREAFLTNSRVGRGHNTFPSGLYSRGLYANSASAPTTMEAWYDAEAKAAAKEIVKKWAAGRDQAQSSLSPGVFTILDGILSNVQQVYTLAYKRLRAGKLIAGIVRVPKPVEPETEVLEEAPPVYTAPPVVSAPTSDALATLFDAWLDEQCGT